MNESELELELRSLVLRSPSPALEDRIATELNPRQLATAPSLSREPRPLTAAVLPSARPAAKGFAWLWQGLGWSLAGAAAAVLAIMAMHRVDSPKATVSTPLAAVSESAGQSFEHVDSTAEIITAEDEGVVYDADSEPFRQVRYRSVERHVWTNPRTGALMEFEVPREDVRLTPVALQ